MAGPTEGIRTYQQIDADGNFHARVVFDEPGSFDLSIMFSEKPLDNGLPHVLGFGYKKGERNSEHGEGCIAAWDSGIIARGEGFIPGEEDPDGD